MNERTKRTAKARGVYLWELAGKFGVTAAWFSTMLRKEFSEEETERALRYIDEIAEEKQRELGANEASL